MRNHCVTILQNCVSYEAEREKMIQLIKSAEYPDCLMVVTVRRKNVSPNADEENFTVQCRQHISSNSFMVMLQILKDLVKAMEKQIKHINSNILRDQDGSAG